MDPLEEKIDRLTEIMTSILAGVEGLMTPLETIEKKLTELTEPRENDAMEAIMNDLTHIKKAIGAVPEKVVTAIQTGELDRVC